MGAFDLGLNWCWQSKESQGKARQGKVGIMGKVFNGVKKVSYLAGLFVIGMCAFLTGGVLLAILGWLFDVLIVPVILAFLFCVLVMLALFLVVVFCIEAIKRHFAGFARR